MDVYGHQHEGPPPSTPSRRQYNQQRYSSAEYTGRQVAAERVDVRSHRGNTRFSLPSPGSRSSPQSLPPRYGRQQAAPPSTTPHYVTPTRIRQHPAQPRTIQANPEQWEDLRSKGYVLKGTGDGPRTSVAFAPALAVIPSQVSSASSSYASTASSPTRRIAPPSFQVHPSLRTGYHPGAAPIHTRPHNQFMRTPLGSLQPHRQAVDDSTPLNHITKYDPVDLSLVPRESTAAQQAITFHASSFTPDPIYRAQYLAQPNHPSHQPRNGPSSGQNHLQQYRHRQQQQHEGDRHGECNNARIPSNLEPQAPRQSIPYTAPTALPIFVRFDATTPIKHVFSRRASSEAEPLKAPGSATCLRSSTLRRQETDQSSYSQATLFEPYFAKTTNQKVEESYNPATPMMLSDWKPLSVESVRSSSQQQDARSLWLDLERALLGTPEIGSSTPVVKGVIDDLDVVKGEILSKLGGETTYDFRETNTEDVQSETEPEGDFRSSLTRPPLLRRDRTKDRLEHHRFLGSSIIEKAQTSAASFGRPSEQEKPKTEEPSNTGPVRSARQTTIKQVRIALEDALIASVQSVETGDRPSRIPILSGTSKRTSKIPIPSRRSGVGPYSPRKAGIKRVAFEQ